MWYYYRDETRLLRPVWNHYPMIRQTDDFFHFSADLQEVLSPKPQTNQDSHIRQTGDFSPKNKTHLSLLPMVLGLSLKVKNQIKHKSRIKTDRLSPPTSPVSREGIYCGISQSKKRLESPAILTLIRKINL